MQVILKLALSLNGFLDEGLKERSVLSNADDKNIVSKLRSEVDAIVIGGGTFRNDNPALLVYRDDDQEIRITENKAPHPLPVIIWGSKTSPHNYLDFKLFNEKSEHKRPVLLFAPSSLKEFSKKLPSHVETEYYDGVRLSADEIMRRLALRGINKVLVEGSGILTPLFLESCTADIIRIAYRGKIFNPETAKRISSTTPIALMGNYTLSKVEKLEGDGNDRMYAVWYVKR